jgi:hypothetical protein
MFDVLARQAADLIERRQSEEVLQKMEETLRSSVVKLKTKAETSGSSDVHINEQTGGDTA